MSRSNYIFLFFVILISTFFISKMLVVSYSVFTIPLIFALLVLMISFYSPELGLIFLIFSMLLSPEIKLAQLPKREVVVRVDDLLIFAVFIGWFVRSVFTKKLEVIVTPLLLPMFLYTLVIIISTFLGILRGYIIFQKAFFYVLKYVEYFMIYFLVLNILRERYFVKVYLISFIITAIIVNIHGYTLIGKVDRIYAPFDIPTAVIGGGEVGAGEANTYGGYLLIVLSLLISLFCYSRTDAKNILYLFLIIFSLVPFVYTKSRASYLAFIPMIISIVALTEKKKNILIGGTLLLFVLSPIFFPKPTQTVVNRIRETFAGPSYSYEEVVILGFKIRELSALARVDAWKRAFIKFIPSSPIFGHGVTGVGLVDAQIPRIIGEVGILGLIIFIWLIISIIKESLNIFYFTQDSLYKSISITVFSVTIALLTHSIAANTFIIIRIMEPFWFLCGMTSAVGRFYSDGHNI